MTRWVALIAGALAGCSAAPAPPPRTPIQPAVLGIDHMPVAVVDLDAAGAGFRALGFTLKPGRSHDNGIRNLHAKFADGTEIELISAPAARDALSGYYARFLERGDGPAALALYAPDPAVLLAALAPWRARIDAEGPIGFQLDDPLAMVFFGGRGPSATDRPEHFRHANGVQGLAGVWLAVDANGEERGLLKALGARFERDRACTPDCAVRTIARLGDGEIVLLPPSRQPQPGRRLVGATVRVADLARTRELLRRSGIGAIERGAGVLVGPKHAHGMWLEFREAR